MLVEAAWRYRFPAQISREQFLRQEHSPHRSVRSPKRRRSGSAFNIASSAGPANRSRPSPRRSPVSWPALSGQSLTRSACQRRNGRHRERKGDHACINPFSVFGQSWGHDHGRRTLVTTNSRTSVRRWFPDRGSFATHQVRRYPTRVSEHDQSSFRGRASYFVHLQTRPNDPAAERQEAICRAHILKRRT